MKEIKIKNETYTKIKELENTIIVAKDGKRYVYHKKKKIIVTPNYDAKPIIKVAEIKARTGRANNDSYSLIRHQNLSERVQKIMDKRRSTMVYESIKSVIHKIEKERSRKELKLNESQREVFRRWRAKAD